MNKVNKSIGWADYSINPVKGKCPVGCSYCYMWGNHGIGKRFHFEKQIHYEFRSWEGIEKLKQPSRIFVGSTIELFHADTIQHLPRIIGQVEQYPQHTFLFLTKCPQNLPRQWPDNCWVGVTATNYDMFVDACGYLCSIKAKGGAKVTFVSLEPILSWEDTDQFCQFWFQHGGIDLLIIGQQTPVSKKTEPKIEDLKEIVEAADRAGVKIFLKDNLKPLVNDPMNKWAFPKLRQELPE